MYEDKTLICKECGKEFVFTAGEQEFYASKGFDYEGEVHSFVQSVLTRKPNQACIDNAVITSKLMDALYRSSEEHREIVL